MHLLSEKITGSRQQLFFFQKKADKHTNTNRLGQKTPQQNTSHGYIFNVGITLER